MLFPFGGCKHTAVVLHGSVWGCGCLRLQSCSAAVLVMYCSGCIRWHFMLGCRDSNGGWRVCKLRAERHGKQQHA